MLVNSAISDPQSSQVNENCNQLNHASHMSLLLYIKGPFPEYSTCTLVTAGDVRPMFQTSRLSDCDAVSKSDIGRREAERGKGKSEPRERKRESWLLLPEAMASQGQLNPGPRVKVCFPRLRSAAHVLHFISPSTADHH